MAEQKRNTRNSKSTKIQPVNDYGRIQPQAPELEEAVLGALMIEKDAYSLVSEILRPESFYERRHQLIYSAIVDLAVNQKPVDILTVKEQLSKRGELEEVGGPFYITQLSSKVASSAHIEYHARIIAQKSLARELITFTSNIQSKAFDETLDVDVKNNPLKFQMPAGGVTIEAMTKDASIEEDEPNILGTAAVVGTAAAGTAILAWQGYQLGTELYLKTALPAGTAIPTNRAELALLVWNHAGKPAPAAVLPADATDTQKAIAWAVENDLLKAAKDNGETYVDTDSVSRVEVIRVWNKAQEK